MNWELFHFIRPWWLLALLPLLWGLWRLWRRSRNGSAWHKVVAPELLPYLLLEEGGARRWPLLLVALGFVLAILAQAGPTWEKLPQPVYSSRSALVILFDLSRSMDAQDVRPSRLVRARFKVEDILRQRREGETALIAFAGAPFTVVPLTDDVKTIHSQLPAFDTALMPVQGSNLGAAIEKGRELLQQAGWSHGLILVVGDGLNGDAARQAAEQAHAAGYRVSVLAVGTEEGAPIPTRRGMLKDDQGNIVLAKLDVAALKAVARAGGGDFARLALDDSDLRALGLFEPGLAPMEPLAEDDRPVTRWRDFGPWLLLVVLPLAALVFRRGVLMVAFIGMLLPLPNPAEAGWWKDLWYRPDQQGQQLLQQQQPEAAAARFRDPAWKASALYRSGDYQEAARLWSRGESAEERYNLGNALARQGKLKAAIEAYELALQRDPSLEDARANKALLEELLK
ncbi:MAG TPA: VWA domain-containing protein, partial [Chromatiaceae bacterium]|nr:VWA domain-containing protein [Chromatiaceae bacterium]